MLEFQSAAKNFETIFYSTQLATRTSAGRGGGRRVADPVTHNRHFDRRCALCTEITFLVLGRRPGPRGLTAVGARPPHTTLPLTDSAGTLAADPAFSTEIRVTVATSKPGAASSCQAAPSMGGKRSPSLSVCGTVQRFIPSESATSRSSQPQARCSLQVTQ
jgi:hypothetical protein